MHVTPASKCWPMIGHIPGPTMTHTPSAIPRLRTFFLVAFAALHVAGGAMVIAALGQMLHYDPQDSTLDMAMMVVVPVFFAFIYTGYLFTRAITGSTLLAALGVWLNFLPVVNYLWIGWLLLRSRKSSQCLT